MARLRESIVTSLPLDQTFDFIADFANSSRWDPGVAWSERVDPGSLAAGARYRLGVRMMGRVAPMEYRITELDRPRRVVLAGQGSGVEAVDEISFTATDSGTQVDYSADIRLTGLLRLATPFAGGAFAKVARDARAGMQATLDAMAAGKAPEAAQAPGAKAGSEA